MDGAVAMPASAPLYVPRLFSNSKMSCSSGPAFSGRSSSSNVNPPPAPTFRFEVVFTSTKLSKPLKLKAWPTSPLVKLVPSNKDAVIAASTTSLALPSPGHQATKPEGAGVQDGGGGGGDGIVNGRTGNGAKLVETSRIGNLHRIISGLRHLDIGQHQRGVGRAGQRCTAKTPLIRQRRRARGRYCK